MLLGIKTILEEPDCSKKFDPVIGKQFIEDREEFNRIAKEWVQKYAVDDPWIMLQKDLWLMLRW